MIVPPPLKPGDSVAIVAPARKISAEQLEPALKNLTSWGLAVSLGKNILSNQHNYLSGSDDERLSDLQTALDDPNIRAVICARGGYGITRIVDKLDLSNLKKNPKWIVGFSDITALHLMIFKAGIASIHGIMPVLFGKTNAETSVSSLKELLFANRFSLHAPPSPLNQVGKCTGKLVGGNISLIADSLGTASEIETDGNILVLEEIDEYIYRLDRMMMHLRRAGKLDNLAGLVIGHLTDMKESELPFSESAELIIKRAVGSVEYPIAFNVPTGHDFPNLAWIHGIEAQFEVNPATIHLGSMHNTSI